MNVPLTLSHVSLALISVPLTLSHVPLSLLHVLLCLLSIPLPLTLINISLTVIIAKLLRINEKCKENICDGEYFISNTLGGILYCVETLHATSLYWTNYLRNHKRSKSFVIVHTLNIS